MSSDGERIDDDSDVSMMIVEEYEGDRRISIAFLAGAGNDWICIDSGCNRLILIDPNGILYYVGISNGYLRTAQNDGRLTIMGRGVIGVCQNVLHCPDAAANLMPASLIAMCGATVKLGATGPRIEDVFCEIECIRTGTHGESDSKTIEAVSNNGLFWIRRTQMMDLLERGGFTIQEIQGFDARDAAREQITKNFVLTACAPLQLNGEEQYGDYAIENQEMVEYHKSMANTRLFRGIAKRNRLSTWQIL